jgi:2-oxoglutarate ferredoxin oxidoreductase subunit alpha
VTAGSILLAAVARAGLYGLMTRSAGPQIRGGESVALVRFADGPVGCLGDRLDWLIGLDWNNVQRFVDELPLDPDSLILADESGEPVPEALAASGARVRRLPLKSIAEGEPGGRLNMAAIGALGAEIGLPLAALESGARDTLGDKGGGVLAASLACIAAGYRLVAGESAPEPAGDDRPAEPAAPPRWSITGNESAGLGALRGGVRFVAAYPITPASEMLEWLAPRLERLGGSLLQAEDELASVNMIVGASFGGVPSLTATSGPGLSLMMEGLGLAVASETPILVVDVQRGGPSTGLPTKSEQSDLAIALHGLHGDAPHLVLAPLSIADCCFTVHWAVGLAEHLQTLALVLSDQLLGQSRAIVDPPSPFAGHLPRRVEGEPGAHYRRYALTEDGVSPMTLPGTPLGMYTADGLEHSERGTPSSQAHDHRDQLAKRLRKLAGFDYGTHWAEIRGDGPTCLITWGSSTGACLEAAERLGSEGRPTRVVALRLIAPLCRAELERALEGAERILVVEQNQEGQLFHWLNGERALPHWAESLARPGPLPLRPGEICRAVRPQPQPGPRPDSDPRAEA